MLRSKELLKKNNEREKLLEKKNNEILTDMIVYLRGSELTEVNQELVRADLIEMVLDAQERGDDIQKVFGENYKEVCDEIIETFPKKTKRQKMLDRLETLFICIWVLSGITAIKGLIGMTANVNGISIPISIGDIINFVLISVVVVLFVEYFTKHVFGGDGGEKKEKASFFKRWFIIGLVFAVPYAIAVFLDHTVFTMHAALLIGITVAAFIGEKITAAQKER